MQIRTLSSAVTDNYFYLVADDDGTECALIDAVDAEVAIRELESLGIPLSYLVNTHGHPDHTGGNAELKDRTGAPICAHVGDQAWVGSVDRLLNDRDELRLGSESLSVLHTPGHTPGHISLFTKGHLFCGDTIFLAGAGNCRFGGNAEILYQSFADIFTALSDETIVYPGHDYSIRNLEFALALDPACDAARLKLAEARKATGICLSTIAEERSYNPFARVHLEAFRQAFHTSHPAAASPQDDPKTVFVALRGLRDNW